ncbi:hypothetical protein GCM10011490_06710 [Pseudoclavibacter endophyticus]|uniref:Uncharacterized protein n=1 Tax=Pseudoclavibacter endophyticus TaxID=1778590 RepID=A0A6H9WFV1_9MICO|nr:hypothetical protein [Pseudoclavibacter endophyticus]KAB1649839.1 hypothetical protein F8O04_06320 [Pseudoclavibacter endophyticus]GGA59370.1 hypothetical protein GCM10011490_06710 [Pseudoclavibacter endophyticus]
MTPEPQPLPEEISAVLQFLGRTRAGYGYLPRREIAKIKASMMNQWSRWHPLTPEALERGCLDAGFRPDEASKIAGYLTRRHNGHRLVPSESRDFRFSKLEPATRTVHVQRTPKHSQEW